MMEYYKILLVDDELEIRDGMIQKLDWHKLGLSLIHIYRCSAYH